MPDNTFKHRPRCVAIIQARMGSTRLPGKVLAQLSGEPMLAHVFLRTSKIEGVARTVIATTQRGEDNAIESLCRSRGWVCFRGSTEDVLDRYYRAAVYYGADQVVRVTGDNPFTCPVEGSRLLRQHLTSHSDYSCLEGLPLGADVEVISAAALGTSWRKAKKPSDREHVTRYAREHPQEFVSCRVRADKDHHYPRLRLTVDEQADLDVARRVYGRLYRTGEIVDLGEAINVLLSDPGISELNACVRQRTS